MNHLRPMLVAAFVLCFSGCATERPIRYQPVQGHFRAEKIDMKIELLLTDAFRSTTVESRVGLFPRRFTLGGALSEYAKALARDLFRDVVVSEQAAAGKEGALVVLKPMAGTVSYSKPSAAFTSALVTFEVAWTLTDPKGKIIWQDQFVGEASERWGDGFGWNSDLRRFVEEAVRDAFSNSFRALSSAERVRTFAKGTR